MGLYLKITVGLLLLVQALQPASAQSSTDSPGRTIDKSWLRKMPVGSQTADEAEEEDLRPEGAASGNGDGTASGFMAVESEEESNVAVQDQLPDETSEDPTVVTGSPTLPSTPQTDQSNASVSSDDAAMTVPGDSSQINGSEAEDGLENSKSLIAVTGSPTFPSTVQTDQPNATMSPNTTATTGPATSSGANGTEAEEGLQNFTATTSQIPTTHPSEGNSTGFPDTGNGTDVQTTTVSPGTNETQAPNATESSDATTVAATTTPGATPTMMPTTTSGPTTTASGAPPIAPEMSSRTDAGAAEGGSSDKDGFSGVSTDARPSKRMGAWAAVLGVGVAVTMIGLVAFVILKQKFRPGFTHRKLVEEYPSDPVLRLDNGSPLDLNFGGSAYYNPALQLDNIQRDNTQRDNTQRDNIQMDNVPGRR